MHAAAYYQHLAQARTELWSFLESLPEDDLDRPLIEGERFRCIKDFLLHITGVEDHWIHGTARAATPVYASGFEHDWRSPQAENYRLFWIRDYSQAVERASTSFVKGLSASDQLHVVEVEGGGGPPHRFTVETLLWHTMTHEVRHQAQVVLLTRQLGYQPPWLDYLRFAPGRSNLT